MILIVLIFYPLLDSLFQEYSLPCSLISMKMTTSLTPDTTEILLTKDSIEISGYVSEFLVKGSLFLTGLGMKFIFNDFSEYVSEIKKVDNYLVFTSSDSSIFHLLKAKINDWLVTEFVLISAFEKIFAKIEYENKLPVKIIAKVNENEVIINNRFIRHNEILLPSKTEIIQKNKELPEKFHRITINYFDYKLKGLQTQ